MMLLAFFLACASDIAIITKQAAPIDTSTTIVDTYDPQPSTEPAGEPSGEPSSELQGTVGLVVYELEPGSCTVCMSVSQELTIS